MKSESKHEAGAILILLALLLFVFAAFLALALEIPQVGGSQRKKYETTQLAALGGLSAYRTAQVTEGASPAEQHRQRLSAAMERLEEVIGFRPNDIQFGRVGRQTLPQLNEIRDSSGIVLSHQTNIAGAVSPGQWFFEEPLGGCAGYSDQVAPCPCPGGSWVKQCFRAAEPGATSISALEVTLRTKVSAPLEFIFGRVIGIPNLQVSARARASVVPMIVVTAIDLSRSVTFENFPPWNRIVGPGSNLAIASEYVFPLDSTNPDSRCNDSFTNLCQSTGRGCRFLEHGYFSPIWEAMERTRDEGRLYPKTKHFQRDYLCLNIEGEHFFIEASVHDYGRIDEFGTRIVEGRHIGPEPLVSILSSFREAMNEMERRSVAGDKIALFGFDQHATASGRRFIGPTSPQDTRIWSDLKDLTNTRAVQTSRPGTGVIDPLLRKRLFDHHFFPHPLRSFTDLAGALFVAHKTIESLPIGATVRKPQVIVFTDGLGNIRHEDFMTVNPEGELELGPDDLSRASCGPNDRRLSYFNNCWDAHYEAVSEAIFLVTDDARMWPRPQSRYEHKAQLAAILGYVPMANRGISVSIALFGQDVQPHVLLRQSKSDPSVCMDDKDARGHWSESRGDFRNLYADDDPSGLNFGNQNCYTTLGDRDSCKYLGVGNSLWRGIALASGGVFFPVRTPCDVTAINQRLPQWNLTTSQCRAGVLKAKLNQDVCSVYEDDPQVDEWGNEYTINHYSIGQAGENVRNLILAGVIDKSIKYLDQSQRPPVVREKDDEDGNGDGGIGNLYNTRIICDTSCRNAEEQIRGLYKGIFSGPSFVLLPDEE